MTMLKSCVCCSSPGLTSKDLAMNDGSTALLRASHHGHLEVARLLLESGADKNLARHDGATALLVSSQIGHLEIARLLRESGG